MLLLVGGYGDGIHSAVWFNGGAGLAVVSSRSNALRFAKCCIKLWKQNTKWGGFRRFERINESKSMYQTRQ